MAKQTVTLVTEGHSEIRYTSGDAMAYVKPIGMTGEEMAVPKNEVVDCFLHGLLGPEIHAEFLLFIAQGPKKS